MYDRLLSRYFNNLVQSKFKDHIYFAKDNLLNRKVVLKIAKKDEASTIENEYSVIKKINSNNIVQVYDLKEIDSIKILVLEFISDPPLSKFIRKAKLSQKKEIVRSLLAVFKEIQLNSIIYRDLMEAHLFFGKKGLRIIDFGNTFTISDNTEYVVNPHTEGFNKTMAPEEFNKNSRLTKATNVYSVSSMIYWIFVNNFPKAEKVLNTKKLPNNWEKVILAGLSENPEDRPSSISDLSIKLKIKL